MPESTFTFRVDESLKEAFTQAARQQDRSGAQLLRDYMREVVQISKERETYDQWFAAKVEEGRQAYLRGEFLTQEEVEAKAQERRQRLLARSQASEGSV
jgi:hypothetical protein